MQSLITAISSDHLKLALTLILALISVIKLSEMGSSRTRIRSEKVKRYGVGNQGGVGRGKEEGGLGWGEGLGMQNLGGVGEGQGEGNMREGIQQNTNKTVQEQQPYWQKLQKQTQKQPPKPVPQPEKPPIIDRKSIWSNFHEIKTNNNIIKQFDQASNRYTRSNQDRTSKVESFKQRKESQFKFGIEKREEQEGKNWREKQLCYNISNSSLNNGSNRINYQTPDPHNIRPQHKYFKQQPNNQLVIKQQLNYSTPGPECDRERIKIADNFTTKSTQNKTQTQNKDNRNKNEQCVTFGSLNYRMFNEFIGGKAGGGEKLVGNVYKEDCQNRSSVVEIVRPIGGAINGQQVVKNIGGNIPGQKNSNNSSNSMKRSCACNCNCHKYQGNEQGQQSNQNLSYQKANNEDYMMECQTPGKQFECVKQPGKCMHQATRQVNESEDSDDSSQHKKNTKNNKTKQISKDRIKPSKKQPSRQNPRTNHLKQPKPTQIPNPTQQNPQQHPNQFPNQFPRNPYPHHSTVPPGYVLVPVEYLAYIVGGIASYSGSTGRESTSANLASNEGNEHGDGGNEVQVGKTKNIRKSKRIQNDNKYKSNKKEGRNL